MKSENGVRIVVEAHRLLHLDNLTPFSFSEGAIMPRDKEKARTRNRRWRLAHLEEFRRSNRERMRKERDEQPERARARDARWYAKHRKRKCDYASAARKSDPDKYRERQRKYRKTEKGAYHHREDARKRNALIRHSRHMSSADAMTRQEWERILLLAKGRCFWCGKKRLLTQDHVIPLSKGGFHVASNVVAACSYCNCHKNAKVITLL